MQSTSAPSKIQLPFASSGAKNTIPVASQVATDPALASFTDGFPPATRTALAAGGKPPYGQDFNGIFNQITSIQQYQCAGGVFSFDASFATAIGGYPMGAIVQSKFRNKQWMSTIDGNTTDPDAGSSANWVASGGGFAVSLAANGYQKLPSGLIIQWGVGTISSGNGTIAFPIAFPSAMASISATSSGSASLTSYLVNAASMGLSGGPVYGTAGGSAATFSFNYIAIGW